MCFRQFTAVCLAELPWPGRKHGPDNASLSKELKIGQPLDPTRWSAEGMLNVKVAGRPPIQT